MRNQINSILPLADKAAIGLSLLCLVHCLALPLAVVLVPSLVALGLDDERFHIWLVIVVIPLSTFALTLGCARHRRSGVILVGLLGLSILSVTPLLGHEQLGESRERLLTLIGAALIAASHCKNFLLCRQVDTCECPD